jgi:glycopeptide antibiotics resistance protein
MPGLVVYVVTCTAVGLGLALLLILAASAVAQRSLLAYLPLVTATMVFVAMTHLPLPAAGAECPLPYTNPQLTPFKLLRRGNEVITLVYSISTFANFLLCALIGALLRRFTGRVMVAAGLAATLSLAVEISQLTGMFGVYPCSWRQFDIDDLILNSAGVLAGFLAAGALLQRMRRGGRR